ncbi:MAG: hypothetical protein KC492_23245, partial [Myxococcales bacterium]|nr:hypothetical protein [Myxococcales bacterium]
MRSPLGTDALEERLRHARDSASRSQGPQRVASALSGLDVLLELRQRGQRTRGAAIDFALATVAIDELRRSDQVEEAMQLTLSVRELAHESGDILALQLLDILAGELLCDCLEFVALERYWERTLGAPLTAQNGESALHRAMGVMSADANCRNRGVRSLARSFAVLGMFEDAQVVYEQLLQLQDGWDLLDASTVQLELLELHADAGHIEHGEALIATMDTSSPMVSLAVGGLKLRAGHLSEARVALRTALES